MVMKIVSIIDRQKKKVMKKILKHCDLWDDSSPPITKQALAEAEQEFVEEVTIDPDFFDMIAWTYDAIAEAMLSVHV